MTGRGRAAAWSITKEVFFFFFFFFGIFGKSYARGRRETKKIVTVALYAILPRDQGNFWLGLLTSFGSTEKREPVFFFFTLDEDSSWRGPWFLSSAKRRNWQN